MLLTEVDGQVVGGYMMGDGRCVMKENEMLVVWLKLVSYANWTCTREVQIRLET